MMVMWTMFVPILCISLKYFVAEGHYYPGQFFAQESQSVFQGASSSSSFGFGFGPGFIPGPGVVGINNGGGIGGGVGGGSAVAGGGIHGQYNPHGVHGWSPYPASPPVPGLPVFQIPINVDFGKPQPPDVTISNELKPSITGWDTTYNVPCGTYTIHPFVVAKIRYTSGGSGPPPYGLGVSARNSRNSKNNRNGRNNGKFEASSWTSSSESSQRENDRVDRVADKDRQQRSYPYPVFPPFNGGPKHCSWDFHAYGSCKLKFQCAWFQLPALFQCDENVMELTDEDALTYRFCGSRKPRGYYVSRSESMKLTFKSRSYSLPSIFDCSVSCTLEAVYGGNKPGSGSGPGSNSSSGKDKNSTGTSQASGQGVSNIPATTQLKYGQCKCGVRGIFPSGRIVGGRKTFPGEFPWTSALVKKNSNRPFCGSALINDRWVITAAHCVQSRKQNRKDGLFELEILLNEHDISKISETPGETIRAKVNRIVIHPQYDNFTYNFDVALLRLEKPIDFARKPHNECKNNTDESNTKYYARMENKFDSQFVPICLPPKTIQSQSYDDMEGIVTGWGLTKEFGGIPSNSMMQATVNIFNDSFCQDFYRAKDVVTRQMLCAGHLEGKMDSCVGDSGGPLVVREKDHYTLAGIVSWGRGCGRPNLPGVYTRMPGLTEWVESQARDGVWCEPA